MTQSPTMNALLKLDQLATTHPEWRPWLCVLREATQALATPVGDAALPTASQPSEQAPLLAGAALRPDGQAVAQLLQQLMQVANAQGLHALAGHSAPKAASSPDDAAAWFLAAVNGDPTQQAMPPGASPEGWRSLLQLLPMPYLHACARQWAAGGEAPWAHGHCPVCAAWPAFAEVRGIARTRHLRCGRCGTGWARPALVCTYCEENRHDALGTLVVDDPLPRCSVEVCHSCSGYLKSFNVLQATPPEEVLVVDLASAEFDIAAVDRGYLRPAGLGVPLRASLA